MGAGASTIADYKEAAAKSDEAGFPEAFAQLKTAVDGFEGDAAAALAYARAIGPERCKNAHLAPPFRKSKESLMTEEQAKRIAAEEGIELIYSATNRHGFKGMHSRDFPGGTSAYSANIPKRYWPPNAKPSDTNCYSYSKWECALQYARALGPEGCKEAHRRASRRVAQDAAEAAVQAAADQTRG